MYIYAQNTNNRKFALEFMATTEYPEKVFCIIIEKVKTEKIKLNPSWY